MKFAYYLVGLLLLWPAAQSRAGSDEGQVQQAPWSGYWWPQREGRILGPLKKYDQLAQRSAAAFHEQRNPAGPEVPSWHGICQGWAAAALLEPEPRQRILAGRGELELALSIGDQKGLLAVSHDNDVTNFYGDRYGDGRGTENRDDLPPDRLWQLLKLYIQQQQLPLVLDIEAGAEVWNFPAFAYRIDYEPLENGPRQLAQLTLWLADDFVDPDFVGVQVRRQTYCFTFELRGGNIASGSAKWHGPSEHDHPDFAWYPYLQRSKNPELDYGQVRELLGKTATEPAHRVPATTTPPPLVINEPVRNESPPTEPAPHIPPAVPATAFPTQAVQPVALSAWELAALVANRTSAFPLDVTIDRFDGGVYRPGERLVLSGISGRKGYLYLLKIEPSGKLSLLYPPAGVDNRIAAEKAFQIPGPDEAFSIKVTGPPGVHRLKAVVVSRPLSLAGLHPVPQEAEPGQRQRSLPGQSFRWPPTQDSQIRQFIRQTQSERGVGAKQLGDLQPSNYLGDFAQDEVAYYVESRKQRRGQP